MKAAFKKLLAKKGWYEYMRYSAFFSIYAFLIKRQVIKDHRREVSFYQSFLPSCSLIFDIGAYDGHKTAAFLELADRVIACEPDNNNFRTLQIRFRNRRSRVMLVNKAVSDQPGTATYYIHHAASAFNTLNPKWKQILEQDGESRWNEKIDFTGQVMVSTITLDQLITQYGKPDFIKIDVEGYEEWVLKGLSQKIPYLSFECLLPDCRAELFACLGLLQHLDEQVQFNVAHEEKLLFKNFTGYDELIKWIDEHSSAGSFEIVAAMKEA